MINYFDSKNELCRVNLSLQDATFDLFIRKSRLQRAFHELKVWQHCSSGCFHSELYRLMCKADVKNKYKLAQGFPEEFFAWYCWYKKKFMDREFETESEFYNFIDEFVQE